MAVGIALAFTWNAAGSHLLGAAGTGAAVTPEVNMTVEQAAAQVWASASPLTAVAGAVVRASPQARDGRHRGTRSARHAHRTGRLADGGCRRVPKPEPASQVRVIPVCSPWPHAPKKLGPESATAR